MQKPLAVIQPAEEPEAGALVGFDAVIVSADAALAPPAGFDALGAPVAMDLMRDVVEGETQREKGDRTILCEAPSGPLGQNVPVPFFHSPYFGAASSGFTRLVNSGVRLSSVKPVIVQPSGSVVIASPAGPR